jgi:DNA polymerase-3 subunit gamma/tau
MRHDEARYVVLARKYRPDNFLDLRGQDVLVRAVSSAILKSRLPQSYLLTGIRGIGKTTSARIIAKTVNCENIQAKNHIAIPCGLCSNCTSAVGGNHPDIIEMDAASRTGVDDIRSIIESAEYKPLLGKYKVFVIDEVHMLSKNAFNAILKLLEEPPAHVLFIFATTEVYKIPVTVLSRCQRFDLKRFDYKHLMDLFLYVCAEESINIDDKALNLLCKYADGSARDGLSLLDQARSLTSANDGTDITADIVTKMVGAASRESTIAYLSALIARNADGALKVVSHIYESNADFMMFHKDLLDVIVCIAKVSASVSNSSHIDDNQVIIDIANKVQIPWIHVVWRLVMKNLQEIKTYPDQLSMMEMLTLQLIYSSAIPSLESLLQPNVQSGAKIGTSDTVIKSDILPRQTSAT